MRFKEQARNIQARLRAEGRNALDRAERVSKRRFNLLREVISVLDYEQQQEFKRMVDELCDQIDKYKKDSTKE